MNSRSNPKLTKTQNAPKKKQPKVSTQVANSKGTMKTIFTVPDCSMDYFSALANPFDTPQGVCLPSADFPIPSSKIVTRIRTQFRLGTTGYGFVVCQPSAANDTTCITTTAAASVGTSSTVFGSFTGKVTLNNTQLPYASAAFTATGVQSRVVAFGLRIKYVGQLMNRNGVIISYEDPDHADMSNNKSFDLLSSNPYTEINRVGDDEWDAVVMYSGPAVPSDADFQASAVPTGVSSSFLGLAIAGQASDLYELEAVFHHEFIGSVVVARSISHADPATYSKVLQTVKSSTSMSPLTPTTTKGIWQRFKEAVAESLPKMITGGGKIISSIISGNIPEALKTASNYSIGDTPFGIGVKALTAYSIPSAQKALMLAGPR